MLDDGDQRVIVKVIAKDLSTMINRRVRLLLFF
jgi:hypothetical protein